MTDRDLFDRVKLTMNRLNTIWSPSGSTFCTRTDNLLNQAVWNDRSPRQSIDAILRADEMLRARYYEWNMDCQDPRMQEWNTIYSGMQDMMRDLIDLR